MTGAALRPTPAGDALPELAGVADIIGSTRIDGIPALFAPREGPITAGLYFRVGRADETLPTSGITHLVEHLALFGQNLSDAHHNGETADGYTHFHVTGTEKEVVAFLNGVCAALRDLPIDRMLTEKEILRTEAALRRTAGSREHHEIERFGAEGPAVVAYGELGLSVVEAEDVLDWARTRFTRGNAALWITTGEIPDGLDLTLPDGPRYPVPVYRDVLSHKPAYYRGAAGGVLVNALVERSVAATVFTRVAAKALFRALRQEGGYSYTADCQYEPLDAQRARITVFADALEAQQAAVVGGVVDVLAALRAGVIDDADLAGARDAIARLSDTPSLGALLLPGTALDLLRGADILSSRARRDALEAVTTADLAAIARTVWDDAIAQIPEGDLEWAGFAPAPRFSDHAVEGESYPRVGDPATALVIGEQGVSMTMPQGSSTVHFDRCAGYLTRPDGARTLIGSDGFRVVIEPTLHVGLSGEVLAGLDQRVPRETFIPLPVRRPDEIPQPPESSAHPTRSRWRGFGAWATFLSIFAAAILVLSIVLTITDTLRIGELRDTGVPITSSSVVGEWTWCAVLAVVTVVLFAGVVRRRDWDRHSSPADGAQR